MARGKYTHLLIALAVLGAMYSVMEYPAGRVIWSISFWVVLLFSLQACASPRQKLFASALFLASLGIGIPGLWLLQTKGAQFYVEHGWMVIATSILHLVFLALVGWLILRDVFTGFSVDVQRIAGAACFYVLLGLAGAWAYQLIACFDQLYLPGSAAFLERGSQMHIKEDSLPTFLYFSFVTLTTLGYGDIQPVDPIARLCAGAQALVGQLYLTILVARLVGQHISQRGLERDEAEE
ncbi:MAG: potassium channel family protein [Planctomycetota bacterium]|jgi:hypothetical protein